MAKKKRAVPLPGSLYEFTQVGLLRFIFAHASPYHRENPCGQLRNGDIVFILPNHIALADGAEGVQQKVVCKYGACWLHLGSEWSRYLKELKA